MSNPIWCWNIISKDVLHYNKNQFWQRGKNRWQKLYYVTIGYWWRKQVCRQVVTKGMLGKPFPDAKYHWLAKDKELATKSCVAKNRWLIMLRRQKLCKFGCFSNF